MSANVAERYGKVPSEATTLAYLKALKVLIAADGDVAPEELAALRKGMKRMGASDAVVKAVEDFNPMGVSVSSVIPNLTSGGRRARLLIRDAIELCSADGTFAEAEKAAINGAASSLGVSAETVKVLHSLVELEAAAKRLRKAVL